ncbi:DUF2201 family putative metallopeptidase [Pseudovibrio ascidiaceicola]|uniref:DUF2201 family putative metallopeptidase n=1 Tax=Pseudovibrio ascidiaceicola TaxID=285279 RepID=UPI003D3607A0
MSHWCFHRDAIAEESFLIRRNDKGDYSVIAASSEVAPAFTDGRTIYYGSVFENWNLDEQPAVCAYEILHIAFQQIPRVHKLSARLGTGYSNHPFDVASDALINESLAQTGYTLPLPCVSLPDLLQNVLEARSSAREALSKLDVESLYRGSLRKGAKYYHNAGLSY